MNSSKSAVWSWLRTLGNVEEMESAREHAWNCLRQNDVLADACRQAIMNGESSLLDLAWDSAARAEVATFVGYVSKQNANASRSLAGVLGTIAATQAIRAARECDLPALVRWVHEAAVAWGGSRAERGLAEALSWHKGLEPHTLLDEHFCALARLAKPSQWRVGAARDSVRSLLGLERRPAIRSRSLQLMACKERAGFLLRLHVELLEEGFGEFFADPASLGLVPFAAETLKAVSTAWMLAGKQSGERTRPGQEAKPGQTLADKLGERDVRWRLEGTSRDSLEGESLGLGMTLALIQLLRDEPLDPHCAVTGAIDEEGNVNRVNHVSAKVAAAWAQSEASGRPAITRIVVPKPNYDEACDGSPGSERVRGVTHLRQALDEAGGLLDAACTLLRSQIAAIDLECRNRTGRPLQQQFVPVRVARGLRPRLRPEEYEQLERECGQGDYSGREKLLSDRNEMLRQAETQRSLERPVVAWENVRERIQRGAVVADPGFGKTMLLWKEVRIRCDEQLSLVLSQRIGPDEVHLSMFLRASELQPMMADRVGQSLGEVLLSCLDARTCLHGFALDWLRERLRAGGVFLAVDALEEVPIDNRDATLTALKEYATDHPKAPLLVSSRLSNYSGCPFPIADADEFELLAFEPDQVDDAVRQWFSDDDARRNEFLKHLKSQPAVRAVLRSPLLLRLACQSAAQSLAAGRPLRLWQRPAELFQDLIENAEEVWISKSANKPTKIQCARFTQIASWVAWLLWQDDLGRSLFTQKGLCDAVEAAAKRYPAFAERPDPIQDLCDGGVIVPAAPDGPGTPYLFTHRTMQEYRAALALAEQPHAVEMALAHVYESDWHPVLQYLGATLRGPRVQEYIRRLLLRNQEDLLCRPFRLAVHAAMNANPRELPPGLPAELTWRIVSMHLRKPDWLGWNTLPALVVCGSRAVPGLLQALTKLPGPAEWKRWATCRASASALAAIQAPEAEPALLSAIFDETPLHISYDFAAALGAMQCLDAVPDLAQSLRNHQDPALRYASALLLGAMRAREAIPDLVQALRDDRDAAVRAGSAGSLGSMQARAALPDLVQALRNDTSTEVRRTSAIAMGRMAAHEAIPPLLKALRESRDGTVRGAAAWALGSIQTREAIPDLLLALSEDRSSATRHNSALALGAMQAQEAVPALIQALNCDGHLSVRSASVVALGRMQAQDAVPSLLQAIRKDRGGGIRGVLFEALGAMQAREALPDLISALREDVHRHIRCKAVEALGAMQLREGAPALLQAIRVDKDREVRHEAAKALARMERLFTEAIPVASAGPTIERKLTRWNASLQGLFAPEP